MRIQLRQLLILILIAQSIFTQNSLAKDSCKNGQVWDDDKGRCVGVKNENASNSPKQKDSGATPQQNNAEANDKEVKPSTAENTTPSETPPTPAEETPRVAGDANTGDKADKPTPQENTPREKKNAKGFDRDVIVAMPPWETTPPQNGARKEHFPVQQLSVNQIDNESNIVNVNVGPIGAHRGLSREEERKAELAKEARAKEDETVIIYLLTDLEQVARSKALRQDINDLKGSITQGDITPEQAKDILQSLLQNTEDEVAQVIAKNEVEKINLLNDIAALENEPNAIASANANTNTTNQLDLTATAQNKLFVDINSVQFDSDLDTASNNNNNIANKNPSQPRELADNAETDDNSEAQLTSLTDAEKRIAALKQYQKKLKQLEGRSLATATAGYGPPWLSNMKHNFSGYFFGGAFGLYSWLIAILGSIFAAAALWYRRRHNKVAASTRSGNADDHEPLSTFTVMKSKNTKRK
jgi:polyhydroxyalkanoate synthesis regulator phasin